MEGPVNQYFIIALTGLQYGLAAGDIIEHKRGILPDGVCRNEINWGIEFPSGPCGFIRRIGGSMKEYMVYARQEYLFYFGFALGECCLEMFPEPGKSFRGGKRFSGNVSRWGSKLQHDKIRLCLPCIGFLPTEPGDIEGCCIEGFAFGNIRWSIDIQKISRAAVGLVFGQEGITGCPLGPVFWHILQYQVGKSFPVITEDQQCIFIRIVRCQ